MILFDGKDLMCVRGERIVFEGLYFSLNRGDALILKGRNGAGKSSLLRILSGLLPLTAGSLMWKQQSIFDEPEEHYKRCQYVGHMNAIKPALTVSENISFWLRVRDANDNNLIKALESFELTDLSDVPTSFLSAGQKRRVALARLLAAPSVVWLLDEPTVSLDEIMVEKFKYIVRNHREEGGIVVMSTHQGFHLDDMVELQLDSL